MARSSGPLSAILLAGLLEGPALGQTFVVSGRVTNEGESVAATIAVFVYDRETNQPIADHTLVTDASGTYSVQVPRSRINLFVTPPVESRLVREEFFNVDIDRDRTIDVELTRLISISGLVRPPVGAEVELWSLSRTQRYAATSTDGTFRIEAAPDQYSIHLRGHAIKPSHTYVDARAGDISGVVVEPANTDEPFAPITPPIASLISISPAGADGVSDVTGQAGAVLPRSAVYVANLQTAQISITTSDPSGAFATRMFAPSGSFISIKHDNTGRYAPQGFPSMDVAPATVLYVPPPAGMLATTGYLVAGLPSVSRIGPLGAHDRGQWRLSMAATPALEPGRLAALSGSLVVDSKNLETLPDLSSVAISIRLEVERIFDAAGTHLAADTFRSSTMTRTGLPIEGAHGRQVTFEEAHVEALRRAAPSRLEADWQGGLGIPAEPGVYRITVSVSASGIPTTGTFRDVFPFATEGIQGCISPLFVFRVGDVRPHLFWAALMNDGSNGSRGAVSLEDKNRHGIASHVLTTSERPIFTRGTFRLEPFLPMLSTSNGNLADIPQLALRLPGGSLHVTVRRPDGVVDDLGSAPFRQTMSRTPSTRGGMPMSGVGNSTAHAGDWLELITLDPRFTYTFPAYGRYVVTMTGQVEDVWGNVYTGGGEYEIYAARVLDIETGTLPGTPLTRTGSVNTTVVVQPPVPADITIRFQVAGSAGSVQTIRGRANRFGIFTHGGGVTPPEAGEYRMDVEAGYTDEEGTLWMGSQTWGSVVQSDHPQRTTHGRRGFDTISGDQPQWMDIRTQRTNSHHLMFPFHTGDVAWMEKNDTTAMQVAVSVQDDAGDLAARVRARAGGIPDFERRVSVGEIPLFSTCDQGGMPAGCQWGYFYAHAQRPGVRVREIVTEDISLGYWRFQDAYQGQFGTGINGDLPNDFKFQFGGAVYRDMSDGFSYYGGYGSLWVMLPLDDMRGRLFPPFPGNGGGPLMTLKGKPIDLFLHPTAVRPGSVLERNQIVSFAGQAAPTLPAKVEIVVTSPSGKTRTLGGQASNIGYLDAGDFPADEIGVWRAQVRATFDGRISAGQMQPPYPTGDVLGSRDGEFSFYVVKRDSEPLSLAAMPAFVRPAAGAIPFTIVPPPGLTDMQLAYTTTMPGFILEEGTTSGLTYVYDAPRLARDFPNLDLYDTDGLAGVDTITISFLLSGTDSEGLRQHYARQIVLQGEELQMPGQRPLPPARRRAAR
jgi:hypothetical protein